MAAITRRLFLSLIGGLTAGTLTGPAEARPRKRRYTETYADAY